MTRTGSVSSKYSAGRGALRHPGLDERLEERARAAIQHRRLRPIDVDAEIVDVGGDDRGQHVLHGVQSGA